MVPPKFATSGSATLIGIRERPLPAHRTEVRFLATAEKQGSTPRGLVPATLISSILGLGCI